MGHFPRPITHILGAIKLLSLAKLSSGIKLIVVVEAFYQLVSITLCFQLQDAFSFHLSFHQFCVVIKDGHEVMVHGNRATLDVHLRWVVLQVDVENAFNSVSCKAIFQKLHLV
jgi:hypothetical protein